MHHFTYEPLSTLFIRTGYTLGFICVLSILRYTPYPTTVLTTVILLPSNRRGTVEYRSVPVTLWLPLLVSAEYRKYF